MFMPADSNKNVPRIGVVGVGGAGGNAVNRMMEKGLNSAEYIVVNTDVQALERNMALNKIQIGPKLTNGMGAGGNPDIGKRAAEESIDELTQAIEGYDMLFITAGMGGGTGTGGAPVIANISKNMGILTVGVVTKPFKFERRRRMENALRGISELKDVVDTLIVIPNEKLMTILPPNATLNEAFSLVDEVLYRAVRGIVELVTKPGLINVDFADVKTVMSEKGNALISLGEARGDNKGRKAAEMAISNPLIDNLDIRKARALLINITTPPNTPFIEAMEPSNFITEQLETENPNVIFGIVEDEALEDEICVTVIATGIPEGKEEELTSPSEVPVYAPMTKRVEPGKLPDISELDKPAYERYKNKAD